MNRGLDGLLRCQIWGEGMKRGEAKERENEGVYACVIVLVYVCVSVGRGGGLRLRKGQDRGRFKLLSP